MLFVSLSSRAAETARDLTHAPLITPPNMRDQSFVSGVLRSAQDDTHEENYFKSANRAGCASWSARALARCSRFSMMNLSNAGSTGRGSSPSNKARQKLLNGLP